MGPDQTAAATPLINWHTQLFEPLKQMLNNVVGFLPNLLEAVGILILGWLVSWLVRVLVKKFLDAIRFNTIAKHMGILEAAGGSASPTTPAAWVSTVFYWFGIFLTWIIALDTAGLRLPSLLIQRMGAFISTLFMGMVIFLLGLFLALVVSRCVEGIAKSLGIAHAGLQAGIIRWAIILFAFTAALSQFGLPPEFLEMVLATIGITLCVTFAIAFGIGGISWVPKFLDKLSK